MYLVRGVKHSTGEYQGTAYDNMMIHVLAPNDGKMFCGDPVEIIKVKTPIFNRVCQSFGIQPLDLVNKEIRVHYDRYGQAFDFEIVKNNPNSK